MREALLLAATAFRRALHTRTFLLVLLLALLVLAVEAGRAGYLRSAEEAGELEQVAAIRATGAATVIGLWSDAALLVGLLLGVTAVSSERRAGTLETLLARPLGRTAFLAGQWLGLQLFVLAFLGLGLAAALVALRLPRLDPAPVFWLGLVLLLGRSVLFTSLGVALGAVLRPVAAGGVVLVLLVLPSLAGPWLDHPATAIRWLAVVGHTLAPATLPGDPIAEGLTRAALAPDHALAALVVLENLLYAGCALLAGGALFARRDPRY